MLSCSQERFPEQSPSVCTPLTFFTSPPPLYLSWSSSCNFIGKYVSIWEFQNRVCLFIPQIRKHSSFINIILTVVVIDTSMEWSSWVLQLRNPKIWIFFKTCQNFWILTCAKELKSPYVVNISPTVVIDTSMKRSSWVLLHGNPKISFSFQKSFKLNFDLCWKAEITLASSISVLQ